MKKYENVKIELISFGTSDIILMSQYESGPIVYAGGAIDGELDYANEVSR